MPDSSSSPPRRTPGQLAARIRAATLHTADTHGQLAEKGSR
jgi:hypothetical protein